MLRYSVDRFSGSRMVRLQDRMVRLEHRMVRPNVVHMVGSLDKLGQLCNDCANWSGKKNIN